MERMIFDSTKDLYEYIEKNISDDVIFVIVMDELGITVFNK